MALSLNQKIENAFAEYQGRWFFGSQIHRDITDEINKIPEDDISQLSLAFYYLTNYTIMASQQLGATEEQTRESTVPETKGIYIGDFIREDYFGDEIDTIQRIQKILSYSPAITNAFKQSAEELFDDITRSGWLDYAASLWPSADIKNRLEILGQFLNFAELHMSRNDIGGTIGSIYARDDLLSHMACYSPNLDETGNIDTLHILVRTDFIEEENLEALLSLTLHEKVHLNLAAMALEISDYWANGHDNEDDFNFPEDSAISYFVRKYKITSLSSSIMSVYFRNPEEKLAYGTQKVFQEKVEDWLDRPLQMLEHSDIPIP